MSVIEFAQKCEFIMELERIELALFRRMAVTLLDTNTSSWLRHSATSDYAKCVSLQYVPIPLPTISMLFKVAVS
jgi:hypothetical protein